MIVPAIPSPPQPPAADPVRQAADDLHRKFLAEMLKQAKLADAFGVNDEGANLAGSLAYEALDKVAASVAATQPGFALHLYEALRRSEPGTT